MEGSPSIKRHRPKANHPYQLRAAGKRIPAGIPCTARCGTLTLCRRLDALRAARRGAERSRLPEGNRQPPGAAKHRPVHNGLKCMLAERHACHSPVGTICRNQNAAVLFRRVRRRTRRRGIPNSPVVQLPTRRIVSRDNNAWQRRNFDVRLSRRHFKHHPGERRIPTHR